MAHVTQHDCDPIAAKLNSRARKRLATRPTQAFRRQDLTARPGSVGEIRADAEFAGGANAARRVIEEVGLAGREGELGERDLDDLAVGLDTAQQVRGEGRIELLREAAKPSPVNLVAVTEAGDRMMSAQLGDQLE